MRSQTPASFKSGVIKESNIDFLHELYTEGIELSPENYDLLVKHGRINPKPENAEKPKKYKKEVGDYNIGNSELQNDADSYIDVVEPMDLPFGDEGKRHVVLDKETYDMLSNTELFKYNGGKQITSDDWKPKDILDHSPEFIAWINSINRGFQTMIPYKPFAMYCQQAEDWLNDGRSFYTITDQFERRDYVFSEMERCRENTLYFMDKYLMLKEGDMSSGNMKYLSKPVHKVLCFLIDAGYSLMVGKPRQIAATSTIGGIALCKTLTRKNFFLKMVAQDKDKVTEIFEDKIKYPFNELPSYLKLSVLNDRDNMLRFGKKAEKKGSKNGANSKIQVVAPSTAAINGGSPQMVLIDEAGYISILGKMIKEARPTMFMQDQETKKLKMTRQIIVWGTGGEMDKGGKAFEVEFYDNLKLWNEGKYSSGMIPLFFDWTTRPGITKEFYTKEKEVYTVEGPEKEAKAVQFRQAYPSIIEDMFLTSHKLLVGTDWLNEQRERILKSEHNIRPVAGYFEPIYDTTRPENENSDVPYRIIGANFIPCGEGDMDRATTWILQYPKKNWKNRYYKGTDPIMTDGGYSKMASAIWDSVFNTPVAIMNYRDPNHKYVFLQSMLLGMFYGTMNELSAKDLVESNIGTAYFDYIDAKGLYNSLVQRTELPDIMQGGSSLYGIDNRGLRNEFIINKLHELLLLYGNTIYFMVVFEQLRTFICTVNDKGNKTWGVTDTRKYDDDVLFALVFSYICAISYSHRTPIDVNSEREKPIMKTRLVRDSDGKLYRARVRA